MNSHLFLHDVIRRHFMALCHDAGLLRHSFVQYVLTYGRWQGQIILKRFLLPTVRSLSTAVRTSGVYNIRYVPYYPSVSLFRRVNRITEHIKTLLATCLEVCFVIWQTYVTARSHLAFNFHREEIKGNAEPYSVIFDFVPPRRPVLHHH